MTSSPPIKVRSGVISRDPPTQVRKSDEDTEREILNGILLRLDQRAGGTSGVAGPSGGPGVRGPAGATGATGATGAAGPGVATGGTIGQTLVKLSGTDYDTGWGTLDEIAAPAASVDFNSQQALSFRIENRTDDIGMTNVGNIWLRTDL